MCLNIGTPKNYYFSIWDKCKINGSKCCVAVFCFTSTVNIYGHVGKVSKPVQTFPEQA